MLPAAKPLFCCNTNNVLRADGTGNAVPSVMFMFSLKVSQNLSPDISSGFVVSL